MVARGNLGASIPYVLAEELVQPLAGAGPVRIERIVSHGHASPLGYWYDQTENEYVLVLSGGATLEIEGGERIAMGPGDWVDLPKGLRHRVVSTHEGEPTVWLVVFYPS